MMTGGQHPVTEQHFRNETRFPTFALDRVDFRYWRNGGTSKNVV